MKLLTFLFTILFAAAGPGASIARASAMLGPTKDHLVANKDEIAKRQRTMMRLKKDFGLDIIKGEPGSPPPVEQAIANLQAIEDHHRDEQIKLGKLKEGADEADKAMLSEHVDNGQSVGGVILNGMSFLAQARQKNVREVDEENVEATDPKTGEEVEKQEDGDFLEMIERRIDRILKAKVDPGAHQAFRQLLWSAAFPCFAGQASGQNPNDEGFINPIRNPQFNVHPEVALWYDFVCERLQDEKTPEAGFPPIVYDQTIKLPVLATYNTGDQVIRYGPASMAGDLAQTLCHESEHWADHVLIKTGISDNAYSGKNYGPEAVKLYKHPKWQNASEFFAYTHMGECTAGYAFASAVLL